MKIKSNSDEKISNSATFETEQFVTNEEKISKRAYCHVLFCTFIVCLGSLDQGYDVGVMAGAILLMAKDLNLNTMEIQAIIAGLTFGSVVGAIIGGQLSNKFGRKVTVMFCAVSSVAGSLLVSFTDSVTMMVIARVILGIGMGAELLISALYTAEISPKVIRGKLVTFSEIFINVGIVLGYLIPFLFSLNTTNVSVWRWMTLIGALPSFFVFVGMIFMPRSPRWLIEQSRENDAKKVLKKISLTKKEAEQTLTEMIETAKMETETMKSSWKEILCICNLSKVLQKALVIGVGVGFFQQATGNEAAVYYTAIILIQAGIGEDMILLGTVFVGLFKVSFIFVAWCLMDKFGRRPLLLTSSLLMTISLLGIGLSFSLNISMLTLVMLCLFMASFSIGWGPVCWVVVSEVYPLKIRDRAMGLSTAVNRLASGLVAFTFLSLQKLLTQPGVFYFYAFIGVISIVFVHVKVPETKGKSLERLSQELISENKDDRNETTEAGNIETHGKQKSAYSKLNKCDMADSDPNDKINV